MHVRLGAWNRASRRSGRSGHGAGGLLRPLDESRYRRSHKVSGRTHYRMIPLPPQKFIDAVAGGPVHSAGHVEVGRQLHTLVKERCCVLPEDEVLDLGCGCGRIAVHFTASQRGEYHGLDIMNPMVEWCRAQITTRFPNFHFHHADLENTLYRGGTENAATFKFPFSDSKFNVVFATSLFTHLLPDSATNYA